MLSEHVCNMVFVDKYLSVKMIAITIFGRRVGSVVRSADDLLLEAQGIEDCLPHFPSRSLDFSVHPHLPSLLRAGGRGWHHCSLRRRVRRING